MTEKLKYGQIIRIHGDSGFVSAKGFTSKDAFFQTYSVLVKLANFRDSLFEILPKGSFEIHDEYHKQPKNKEILQARMATELNQYMSHVQSKSDEEVLFGQEVIFRHLDSNFYLQGTYKCSNHAADAFCINLLPYPTSHALFRINPHHTYQREGQNINYDEPVKIFNVKQRFGLTYLKIENGYDEVSESEKYQLVINDTELQWKFKLQYTQITKVIKPNDLIFLQYSENQGQLRADRTSVSLASKQLDLIKNSEDSVALGAIWEIVPKYEAQRRFTRSEHPKFSVLEGRSPRIFSETKIDKRLQEYVLRHYLTGLVLSSYDGKPILRPYIIAQSQHMEIKLAKQGENEVKQNTYVTINNDKYTLMTNSEEDQWNDSKSAEQKLQFFFGESQHAFKVKKIPPKSKYNLLYLISAQMQLQEFSEIMSMSMEDVLRFIDAEKISKTIDIIQDLIQFLEEDLTVRQFAVKQTDITQYLMKILTNIADKNLYGLDVKNERRKFKKLFKQIYELIKTLIQNNMDLKLYISQWLEVFLNQAILIDEQRVQDTLKDLLMDNLEAIQKFITDDLIDKVVEMLQHNPHEKFLKILSSVCVCQHKPIPKNQNYIFNILQKQIIQYSFKFQIVDGKVLIQSHIDIANLNWRTVKQFYQESHDTDQLQTWKYFQSYIILLSDVCYSRNKQAQDFISENIPLSILLAFIQDQVIQEENATGCFLRLIHLAYIDNYKHQTHLISKVIDWDKCSTQDINSVEITAEVKEVMLYVQKFISKFSHFSYNTVYNRILLIVLKIIKSGLFLGFWQSITTLQNILHDLLRMCSCQQDFLKYEDEKQESSFKKAKFRMTRMSEENKLIMDCKFLAGQLVLTIFEQENYVRVNKTVSILKEKLNQKEPELSVIIQPQGYLQKLKAVVMNKLTYYIQLQQEQQPINSSRNLFFKQAANTLKKTKDVRDLNAYAVQQWIFDLQSLLQNRDLFKQFSYNILLIFVEMSLYQNPLMVDLSLQILGKIYGQRRDLIQNLSKVVIRSGRQDNVYNLSVKSIEIRQKLEILNRHNVNEQSDISNMVEEIQKPLEYLCSTLKNNNGQPNELQLTISYTERDENEKMTQSLYRAQNLHLGILEFITHVQNLTEPLQKLLNVSYKFLTLFIWNHPINQIETQWPLDQIYWHLTFSTSCVDFIRELFHNNKELLYKESEIQKLVKCIVEQVNRYDSDDFRKSKLLDILRVIQYDHNKVIKYNQLITLSLLQDRQYDNIMIFLNQQSAQFSLVQSKNVISKHMPSNLWDEQEFFDLIKEYNISYSKIDQTKLLVIQGPLMYMIIYFEIFSLLVEDKNTINMEKCMSLHPYKSLLSVLKHCYHDDVWPLQHFIRSYINRLYYNRELDHLTQLIVDYDLDIILYQLQSIIKAKEQPYIKDVKIQDGIRFQYLFSYIFACLQETLYSINLIFVNEEFLIELEELLDRKDFKLHVKLFKIAGCLVQIERLWFKSGYITNICQVLTNVFKLIFKQFNVIDLQRIETMLTGNVVHVEVVTPKLAKTPIYEDSKPKTFNHIKLDDTDLLINKLLHLQELQLSESQMKVSKLQFNLKKMFHLKSLRKLSSIDHYDDDKELNINIQKLVNVFNENQSFQVYLDQEFFEMCQQIDQVDVISQKAYLVPGGIITLKEFIKNLINMNITHKLNDDVTIFFLRILVRMISEKNPDQDLRVPIDEWTPEFWSPYKKQIEEVQNFLEECGAASLIFNMFKQQDKPLILNQLLVFANALLLGGNTKCQNALLALLKQDQYNSMMSNLEQIISKFSKFVVKNFKLKKSKQLKQKQNYLLSIVYLDNLTSFNDQTETLKRVLPSAMESHESQQNRQISRQILCRTFRMLQLLCENNNVDFKNYLREQSDKEGQVHINSINFIEMATKELRIQLKILNKNVIQITSQIVDFINEVIQLPCQLNQVTLCKSTFLEDVCFMSDLFTKKQFQKQRELDTQDQVEKLFELQGKIIQSIMLVLEGNDQKNYDDLQGKLDPNFLVGFVRTIVSNMGIVSSKDIVINDPQFSQEIQQMINVFIIFEKIKYKVKQSKWLGKFQNEFDSDEQLRDIQQFCQSNLRKIEIYYEEHPQMVFFPFHPVFNYLSNETRDILMFEIPRKTQREKLISLIEISENIFSEIAYGFKLHQQIIPISHQGISSMKSISLLLSLVINVYIVIAYYVQIKDKQSQFITDEKEEYILYLLSRIQLVLSIIICTFYLICRAPLEFKKLKQEPFQITKPYIYIYSIIKNIVTVLSNDDIISYLSYTAITLVATLQRTYYFSLHLFYLFGYSPILKNVFQAISHNVQQLTMVALLGVLFQFVFSIVGFSNYVDDIYSEEQPQDPCDSIISCMITLMTSGVIGTSMKTWDPLKFIYDTIYFVFFGLLFTNLISGIMIDTMAQLRDERDMIEDDKQNKCFICGTDRQKLEKNQEDFEDHIKSKHFLWNYVFYLYCLQNKDSTEYTGLEYWIYDKIQNESTSWFPIEGVDKDDLGNQFDQINKKLDFLIQKLDSQEEQDV